MGVYRFADLFSGCGGLSLGLTLSGMVGQFAVERDPMAFETFEANLAGEGDGQVRQFEWPSWLEKKAWGIEELLDKHLDDLKSLRGKIDVLAGGPPCQGFSFAGRRQGDDPRNMLFEKYVEVVEALQPSAVILENVPGMRVAHAFKGPAKVGDAAPGSFYDKLLSSLDASGYAVEGLVLDAANFGVPQRRSRLIAIGVRKELAVFLPGGIGRVRPVVEMVRLTQLAELKLPARVAAGDAISDLRTKGRPLVPCTDPQSRDGYFELDYDVPTTTYQRLMRLPWPPAAMDSMRLARHSPEVAARFARIIAECTKGVRMNEESRERFGLKKHRIYPMAKGDPGPTITTLPDDILHYDEPRILTVRESARLQSFPDWFEFKGKFTTGGNRRTKECPRYTQVGNAVPPYLGRALGYAVTVLLDEIATARQELSDADRIAANDSVPLHPAMANP